MSIRPGSLLPTFPWQSSEPRTGPLTCVGQRLSAALQGGRFFATLHPATLHSRRCHCRGYSALVDVAIGVLGIFVDVWNLVVKPTPDAVELSQREKKSITTHHPAAAQLQFRPPGSPVISADVWRQQALALPGLSTVPDEHVRHGANLRRGRSMDVQRQAVYDHARRGVIIRGPRCAGASVDGRPGGPRVGDPSATAWSPSRSSGQRTSSAATFHRRAGPGGRASSA